MAIPSERSIRKLYSSEGLHGTQNLGHDVGDCAARRKEYCCTQQVLFKQYLHPTRIYSYIAVFTQFCSNRTAA